MMVVNYDNDIGEYWEFAGSPYVEIDLTNDAFKLASTTSVSPCSTENRKANEPNRKKPPKPHQLSSTRRSMSRWLRSASLPTS